MVTVVDCYNFFKDFGSAELLMDRGLTDLDGDYRTIVNLLTDQIEFANVIVLNKTDLVEQNTVGLLKSAIQKLNPGAKIIESVFGKIAPSQILNTGMFDFEEAQMSAGWQKELKAGEHTPETEEYGISSFVFRNQKPFHPERLWSYIYEDYPATVIRSKGLFNIASRPGDAINFSQAGGSSRIEKAGVWWCSMPYERRIEYQSFVQNKEVIESRWHAKWGDRINELVFIGQDMDKEKIINDLESCLLNELEEEAFLSKSSFKDPFPKEI